MICKRFLIRQTTIAIFCSMILILTACSSNESDSTKNSTDSPSPELIEQGEQLYLSLGCAQCHTRDGKRLLAPTFKGLYGKPENLENGATVIVDDEYIKESILEPEAKIVAGFQPMHPPLIWDLDETKLNALVAFIKSLK